MDNIARNFQRKVDELMEGFAKRSLPFQRKAAECQVQCFDKFSEPKDIMTCGQKCASSQGELQTFATKQLNMLQSQITNCAQKCENDYAPVPGTTPSDDMKDSIMKNIQGCMTQCFQTAEPEIENISGRLQNFLDQNS